MKTTVLDARTVAIVRDLKVEQRTGANGTFESKDILFRIAVDRDYKVTRQENGKTISEYPTDFWLAKATGATAQAIADYCTATKEDGKLISRHLLLNGNFETYQKARKVKVQPQVNINGQLYQLDLEVDVPDTNTIFVIDSFKFLDRNPENVQSANTGNSVTMASLTPISPVPATQTPQPVQASAPVNTAPAVAVAPVQVAQPVATVAVAQPAQTDVVGINPPVVDPNFVPAGETAPF